MLRLLTLLHATAAAFPMLGAEITLGERTKMSWDPPQNGDDLPPPPLQTRPAATPQPHTWREEIGESQWGLKMRMRYLLPPQTLTKPAHAKGRPLVTLTLPLERTRRSRPYDAR